MMTTATPNKTTKGVDAMAMVFDAVSGHLLYDIEVEPDGRGHVRHLYHKHQVNLEPDAVYPQSIDGGYDHG